jgi:hypothetical protein
MKTISFSLVLTFILVFPVYFLQAQNYQWAHGVGSTHSDIGRSSAIDMHGNLYVTGSFERTADFDPSFATANLVSAGSPDIFLAKYDSLGNYLWAISMGSLGFDYGTSVSTDTSGNVYITGTFERTVDFDPSSAIANLTTSNYSSIFLAKYDSSGNYLWAIKFGGVGNNVRSVSVDSKGYAYVTGSFRGTGDFDPTSSTANLTSTGNMDIFLAKYNSSGNYIWAINMGGTGHDYGYSVVFDKNSNSYICGQFRDSVKLYSNLKKSAVL